MTLDAFHKDPTLIDLVEEEKAVSSPIPDKIGEYKIESRLSAGGMSVIYLGLHPETRQPLIIKVLSKEYASHPEMVERFMREAEIIELANHPNIVKLYGHGQWEGGLYIAMEFVQGISLREMILQQTISLKRALELVIQISQALAHLHTHGIIHRDLKPENVLLTGSGGVKVIDFGIAALDDPDKMRKKEAAKRLMGTPAYMSPEQRENPTTVTFNSDIYSLGVITYELVLGRLSHGVIHLSMMPRGLQKILAKALQSNPQERYQDIIDFMYDLSTYLASDDLRKELRASDHMGELSENLKSAQSLLISSQVPSWPRLDIAVASNTSTAISSVYLDFFQKKPGVYTIVLGESIATGMEGLLSIATLKGMVRSLSRQMESPRELIATLNDLIVEEEGDQSYALSFLTLFPNENRLSYISCGYSPLWYIPSGADTPRRLMAENIALGIAPSIDILEVDSNWNVGDALVAHTFQAGLSKTMADLETDESLFLEVLKDNLFAVPKQQVDAIFRKVSKPEPSSLFERPVTLISIARGG